MADIGVAIDHHHWRNGYGREVLVGLLEHASTHLGLRAAHDRDAGDERAGAVVDEEG